MDYNDEYYKRAALFYANDMGIDLGNYYDGRNQKLDDIARWLKGIRVAVKSLEAAE